MNGQSNKELNNLFEEYGRLSLLIKLLMMFFVYRFWYLVSIDNRALDECKAKEIVLAIERSSLSVFFDMLKRFRKTNTYTSILNQIEVKIIEMRAALGSKREVGLVELTESKRKEQEAEKGKQEAEEIARQEANRARKAEINDIVSNLQVIFLFGDSSGAEENELHLRTTYGIEKCFLQQLSKDCFNNESRKMNHDLLKSKINEYLCKGSSKEPTLILVETKVNNSNRRNTFFGGFSDAKKSIYIVDEYVSLTK